MKETAIPFILGLLLINFLLLAYYSHSNNLNCGLVDQSAYMETAIWVKEHGGPTNFLKLCFTGEYKEDNRHPLYILLIAPFAARNIRFFPKAKLVSTFTALLFVVIFYLFVKAEFGFLTSVISTGLLITTSMYVQYFSWIACEYLLITFTLLTWYFTYKGFDNNKFWVLGGMFNGAAYLSKASGFFFLLAFGLTCLIVNLKNKTIRNLLTNKWFYAYFLAFGLVSSPLLIRNMVAYKSLFHSYGGKIMWLDSWEQHYLPGMMEKANMWNYLQTHSVGNIAGRFISGMKVQFSIFRKSFENVIIQYANYYVSQSYVLLLLILGIIYIAKDTDNYRKLYNIIIFAVFYLILSFFTPCGSGYRYFMPVTTIFLIYISIGITGIASRMSEAYKIKAESCHNIMGFTIIALLGLMLSLNVILDKGIGFRNPLDMYTVYPGEYDLSDWMVRNIKAKDVVYQTPFLAPYVLTSDLFSPINGHKINIPPLQRFEEFAELIKINQAAYVIMTKKGFLRRREIFNGYIEDSPESGLFVKKIPSGWKLEYSDRHKPVDFLVFKTV